MVSILVVGDVDVDGAMGLILVVMGCGFDFTDGVGWMMKFLSF